MDTSDACERWRASNRMADRMLSLADVALSEPALANAVRVASDILKWSAMVRNRRTYGDQQRLEVNIGSDLGERLRRARSRVIEHENEQPSTAIGAPVVANTMGEAKRGSKIQSSECAVHHSLCECPNV